MPDKKKKKKIALVAIGGNFLLKEGQTGTIGEQEKNARTICKYLVKVLERGYNLVITHGNGPQVGNMQMRNALAANLVPPYPLDVLVAQTCGSIGYVLQQEFLNIKRRKRIANYVVTMITQVMVNHKDPAFKNPTKPVGFFFSKSESVRMAALNKWSMVEDAGRGWRRVVASPKPLRIIQSPMIRDLANEGHVVIALGGGGIPMTKQKGGYYIGMEAVIDKDRSSALLAREIDADLFVLLTAVPKISLNFKTTDQKDLDVATVEEMKKYMEEGHFPPGSMGPKVECAIDYISGGGGEVIITDPKHLDAALLGKAGTRIVSECKKKPANEKPEKAGKKTRKNKNRKKKRNKKKPR